MSVGVVFFSRYRVRCGRYPGGLGNQAGFSTIEVIATVLLLAAGLVPLFDAMTNIQRNARLVARNELRSTSLTDAIEYLKSVNVGVAKTGDVSFDAWSLDWSAEEIPSPVPDEEDQESIKRLVSGVLPETVRVVFNAQSRQRTVALYRVTARIALVSARGGDPLTQTVVLHMVGWDDGGS